MHADGDATQKQGEPIAVFRLHWVVLLRPAVLLGIAGIGCMLAWAAAGAYFGPDLHRIAPTLALASVGALIVAAGPLMQAGFRRLTTQMVVYPDRIVLSAGLLQNLVRSISNSEIVGVNLYQAVGQRLLGCGDLQLDTRGVDNIVMRDVERVEEARTLCQSVAFRGRPFDNGIGGTGLR